MMDSFLQLVARDLLTTSNGDLSRTAVVFPNKRASLFFSQHLAREAGQRPLWAPTYLSISELFSQFTPLRLGQTMELVCELYPIYRQVTGSTEPIDNFYFWGELLVADFDDVDKNLVPADRLFANLSDLKTITDQADNSFLDPEQVAAIQRFFAYFNPEQQTKLKREFFQVWEKMGALYHAYQDRLQGLGMAYEGMLQREALNNLSGILNANTGKICMPQSCVTDSYQYAFVGFNALNRVEHQLFSLLKQTGQALFYWDYDASYVALDVDGRPASPLSNAPIHEAGTFMRTNLREFPNRLDTSLFHSMDQPKQITFASAPTENAQAHYVTSWTRTLFTPDEGGGGHLPGQESETAIVLCNEALLMPVLHAIPSEVASVNITMGFPLIQTPAYSLLQALLSLQTEGIQASSNGQVYKVETVTRVLRHPYVRQLSPQADELRRGLESKAQFFPKPADLAADDALRRIFTPQTDVTALCSYLSDVLALAASTYRNESASHPTGNPMSALYREALFEAYTLVGQMLYLIQNHRLDLQIATFRRLLERLLAAAKIPFHGEPAVGMQVMGVLETRTLDFRNLLMLSVSEGNIPKSGGESSFIPYSLRKAFGMTTPDQQGAVYAYTFHRLLQRAERITLAYNASTEGMNRGEMSRFMLQLLVGSQQPIRRISLQSPHLPGRTRSIAIPKSGTMLERLQSRFHASLNPKATFSPSSLNTYLNCPLQFYFHYVAQLKPPTRITADVDSAMFGTLFHAAAQLMYIKLTERSRQILASDLRLIADNTAILKVFVDRAFREKFFMLSPNESMTYDGTQLVISRIIVRYLHQLLQTDMPLESFCIEGLECPVSDVINVPTPQGKLPIRVGGIIDRLDSQTNDQRTLLRIIDYKTGGDEQKAESIEHIFTPDPQRPSRILQTFLYADIVCRRPRKYLAECQGNQKPILVSPCLLLIHKSASPDYNPVIQMGPPRQKEPVGDFTPLADAFRKRLTALLQEIFDPNVPFTQPPFTDHCAFCDYRQLCKR